MAVPLSAKDIISSSPSDLLVGPSRTTSDNTHNLEFQRTLVHWKKFEEEVRASSNDVRWASYPSALPYGSVAANQHQVIPSEPEVWRCGDANSVSHRIGLITGQAFRTLQIPIWFGDYKAYRLTSSAKTPDIVMTDEEGNLAALGEIKSPWILILRDATGEGQEGYRHCLGLLGKYMHIHQVKYAFLTTYNETIFCKQDLPPTKSQRKRPGRGQELALWYSDVIQHNGASQLVFLRECFLFLGIQVRDGDYKFENIMRLRNWVNARTGSYPDHENLSPDDTSAYAERRQQGREPRATDRFTISQARNALG
ncbi:hypothetical protein N7478_010810 [Penicillium angulare]|uniref:uncharacterized protein n=1 Tax=Penicillium angulare TaxID=116970 RepID=UPI0025400624|nr:uncharacterized protein N7478_010810 [Penicillium angulare]KAJ5263205.1 hypothetical protein N7478_010810 [Penicillium angulare]